jgi:hypothetical protein
VRFLALPTITLLLYFVYKTQIQELYAYMGFVSIPAGALDVVLVVMEVLAIALVIPREVKRPSDVFILVTSIAVLLPCALFSGSVAYGSEETRLALFAFLFFPVLAVRIIQRIKWAPLPTLSWWRPVSIAYAAIPLFAIVALTAYMKADGIAGWDWAEQYERRRDIGEMFGAGSPLSYLLSMIGNGFAPLVAFIGVLHRRKMLALAGVLFPFFSFFVLGIKAQVLFAAAAVWLGLRCRRGNHANFGTHILTAIAAICVAAIIEYELWESSFLAGVFVRRAFSVVGANHAFFFDFILHPTKPDTHVLYYIGWEYMREPLMSANTTGFLVAATRFGALGYMLALFLTLAIIVLLDRLYIGSRNKELLCIALLFAAILTTQEITTLLVSSGVAVMLAAMFFLKGHHYSAPAAVRT